MIHIEQTPNPNSLKFLSEKKISEVGSIEFQKKDLKKIENIFVKNLLSINGIELILLSENFLSVNKQTETSWDELKPTIISHMNEYFEKNKEPILKVTKKSNKKEEKQDDVVSRIKEVLDSKVRPAVARDGGDITFKSFEAGVVKVELKGSCSGCPSSVLTLKQGVQNLLKHYVKEVNNVEAI